MRLCGLSPREVYIATAMNSAAQSFLDDRQYAHDLNYFQNARAYAYAKLTGADVLNIPCQQSITY